MGFRKLFSSEVFQCERCGEKIILSENEPLPSKCFSCENQLNDLWLYRNAIVELIYDNGDRETIRYNGQKIKTKYCCRATPWEFIEKEVYSIDINNLKTIEYIHKGDFKTIHWENCPDELLGKENLIRPIWTEYLRSE